MIDPADNVTQPLSVTTPVPMCVVVDMAQQVVEAALVQDLLGDWFVTQKITGKSTSGKLLPQSRHRTTMVSNQEDGFAVLDALVRRHEKAGGVLRCHPIASPAIL